MTTDLTHVSERARKAVYARRLTDPLGARGFRRTGERVEREAKARRLVFVTALAAFAGILGAIFSQAEQSTQVAAPQELVMEFPIPSSAPGEPLTVVRILQPAVQPAPQPHVRTRATG